VHRNGVFAGDIRPSRKLCKGPFRHSATESTFSCVAIRCRPQSFTLLHQQTNWRASPCACSMLQKNHNVFASWSEGTIPLSYHTTLHLPRGCENTSRTQGIALTWSGKVVGRRCSGSAR